MSSPVIINNPILNSPFAAPARHFRFDANNEITNTIDEGRRGSIYFLPIATPKKKGAPGLFDKLEEKKEESGHVNRIRALVKPWHDLGWPDITPTTRVLLEHWHDEQRFRKLFFCQLEALETLIFITEVAKQSTYGEDWIEKYLRDMGEQAGTKLLRIASKMATGSGKTVVMSMLIAWQVLNKRRYPQDKRFTDAFLVVTPGITIRDRLRVLLPSDPGNYYQALDIVPAEYRADLGTAKIVVTNFHSFKLRMVFGEPDIEIAKDKKTYQYTVTIKGLDVYDPTTGEVRSNSTDDIACWFIDTNYDDQSFFVRHAYFCGGDEPYEKLKRALRAEVDEAEWSKLYSTVSLPFDAPKSGKIAVKVINHYGDEVLKVYRVG